MTFFARNHNCCTCEYWDGPRQIKRNPKEIEAVSSAKGTCCGPSRMYRGKQVTALMHSSEWRTCYELKHGMIE